jgi:DNA mismatch repair protein MutL
MASRIIVLDESVINKIAAGEVVERPASVVKELVENAIDAGATEIVVDLVEGGKKLIRVSDDGFGMSDEDAVLALQRHATSKVQTAEDLVGIMSLGFRGEALPSIASVSQLGLTSREHDNAEGIRVVVDGGEVVDYSPVGCPPGTTIEVRNLFFNTPARLKFLRTSATERGHSADVVSRAALGYPEIGFRVTHNEHAILSSPPGSDMLAVMAAVYGKNVARQLIPLEFEEGGVRIHGYISDPALSRVNRSYQAFFVNRRYARSRLLGHALSDPYKAALPSGRFPVAAIHIAIDPRLVDPNVHPAKIEVRFTREWDVHNLLRQAVEQTLSGHQIPGSVSLLREERRRPGGPSQRAFGANTPRPLEPRGEGIEERRWEPRPDADMSDFRAEVRRKAGLGDEQRDQARPLASAADTWLGARQLRVIGQAQNTYIIAEVENQIVLVDQHVASERILYEQLMAADSSRETATQLLMIPTTLELAQREKAALEDSIEELRRLGFELEEFGGDAYILRGIPQMLVGQNYEQVLRDMLEELAESKQARKLDEQRRSVVTTLACHAAVKAGETLDGREMSKLLDGLLGTQEPTRCPHGRPIVMAIDRAELDQYFGR